MSLIFLLAVGVVIVVVIAIVVTAASKRDSGVSPLVPPHPVGGSLDDGDVRALLSQGRKIEAIKLVRERTGFGLAEAKAYVDKVESGQGAGPLPVGAAPVSSGNVDADARALIAAGKKIEAIKLVRERTGLGLAEAKAHVDRLESS